MLAEDWLPNGLEEQTQVEDWALLQLPSRRPLRMLTAAHRRHNLQMGIGQPMALYHLQGMLEQCNLVDMNE